MSIENKVAFITGGDEKFLPLVEVFLRSIKQSTDIPVIVYGFNCKPKFKIDGVITKEIGVDNKTPIGRDTSLYYAKIHASLDVLNEDYDTFIWLDADCVVTKNITNLLKYTNNLPNYPLFMRYKHNDLSHWNIDKNGMKQYAGHGEEAGNLLNIHRNNNFTIATGLYIFNNKSKWFFEELLRTNKSLINVDSTHFIDDLALSEERLSNVLMWKYNLKNHLPITWLSGADSKNNQVDDINLLDKMEEILGWDKALDIMYEIDGNNFPINQNKMLFYHGTKNVKVMGDIYSKLFKPTKLMVVAHPDDESIFGGISLLNEYGWKVICMTGASDTIRFEDFKKAMAFAGVSKYEVFDFKNGLNIPFNKNEVMPILQKEIDNNNYKKILTHNEVGEYGHTQHISLHNIVKSMVKNNLYTFSYSDKLDSKLLFYKKNLLSLYTTEKTNLPGFASYVANESMVGVKFNIDAFLKEIPGLTSKSRESNRMEFYKYIIPKLIAKNKPIYLVETGTISESVKTNDFAFTYIMGKLIKNYTGGKLITIDIDENKLNKAKEITKDFADVIEYIHSDSVKYLKSMTDEEVNKVDLFILDSFDIDFENPASSAQHHLNEFLAIYNRLNDNTIIGVDDNWFPNSEMQLYTIMHATNEWIPTKFINTGSKIIGKGAKINELLQGSKWKMNNEINIGQGKRHIFVYEHNETIEGKTMDKKDIVIKAHTSYIGTTGYNRHAQEFFKELNKLIDVRIRNFTVCSEYVPTKEDKEMLTTQTLWNNGERKDYPLFAKYDFNNKNIVNLILSETRHYYFYDKYEGPKIAYNVWETTRQPQEYFNKLKEFDQLWVPTQWQKDCSIEQGYPTDRVKVVPEAVDGEIFKPANFDKEFAPYSDGRFKFVIFGRWDYRKATAEIIRAFLNTFDKSEPIDLIISTDNMWNVDGLKSTEERLKVYNLEDERIKIVHFPSREDYIKYLQNGHVFVSCARGEGWNLPLIEAMACGTPSMYSDWGAELEFAKDKGIPVKIVGMKPANNIFGKGYTQSDMPGDYCEPNFNDLSDRMRDVYENYSYFKDKALKESKEIREKFSWKNVASIAYKIIEDDFISPISEENIDITKLGRIKHSSLINNDTGYNSIKEEIIEEKIYEKYFKINKGDVVVDLGANIGLFSLRCLRKDIDKCYVMEPAEKAWDDLVWNINHNAKPNKVILINKAITEKTGTAYLNCNNGLASRVINDENGIAMDGISFKDFIHENNISKIDFLKVDIEGGEYNIFCDEENFKFIKKNVHKIAMELHMCANTINPRPLEVIKNLESLGFNVIQNSIDGLDIKLNENNVKNYYNETLLYAINMNFENEENIYKESKHYESEDKMLKGIKKKYNEITVNFIDGPRVEITGNIDKKYKISFFDFENGESVHTSTISTNHWTKANRRYFTDYLITVEDIADNNKVVFHHKYNAKNKKVYIQLDSKALGDTLAWFPYVEEFRKKHNCKVVCSTFWNKFFANDYPEITFVNPGTNVNDVYAHYIIGWFQKDAKWLNPNNVRTIPLQRTAPDILGLEYKEIKPKITFPQDDRPVDRKYVCIAPHATAQSKYWNYPDGWNILVKHLKSLGYKVVLISKESSPYGRSPYWNYSPKDVIDHSGNYSIEQIMNDLKHADFFIGLSSGLSWLAWAVGIPTVMISGFSEPFCEFIGNNYRLNNNEVCHGCFNDPTCNFDADDWLWCPRLGTTEDRFICSKTITPDMVFKKVQELIYDSVKKSILETPLTTYKTSETKRIGE